MQTKTYTVQLGFADYCANTVLVEAHDVPEALDKAIREGNGDADWKRIDHAGDTFVDAVAEGDRDPWDDGGASCLHVPARYTEAALHVDVDAARKALHAFGRIDSLLRDFHDIAAVDDDLDEEDRATTWLDTVFAYLQAQVALAKGDAR